MKGKTEAERKLYRSEGNKVIAGVAGGLGEYFNIDPVVVRLIFVAVTLLGGGGVIAYLIMWLVIPTQNSSEKALSQEVVHENAKDIANTARMYADEMNMKNTKKKENKGSGKFGWLLLILGILLLISNLGWFRMVDWERFWPLVLVVLGLYFLAK